MRDNRSFLAKAAAGDNVSAGLVSRPLDTVSGEPHIPGSQKARETPSLLAMGKPEAAAGDEGTAGLVSPPLVDPKKRKQQTSRQMDDEIHKKPVSPVDKFDTNAIPVARHPLGLDGYPVPIRKLKRDGVLDPKIKSCATSAMAKYNEVERTDYKFVDVKMANWRMVQGIKYYLTFEGSLPDETVDTFEAIVVYRSLEDDKIFVMGVGIKKPDATWHYFERRSS